ncbi:hypothetical protein A2U01_0112573, partial [Trifolium medium]|nr:hypothetical protein [Trifolium medium]
RFLVRLLDRQCCQPVLVLVRSPPEKGQDRTNVEENGGRCHDRRHHGCVVHWPWMMVENLIGFCS